VRTGFWFTEYGSLDFVKWRAVHLLAAAALCVLAAYVAALPSYALVAFAGWQMGNNWSRAHSDLSWRAPWRFFL